MQRDGSDKPGERQDAGIKSPPSSLLSCTCQPCSRVSREGFAHPPSVSESPGGGGVGWSQPVDFQATLFQIYLMRILSGGAHLPEFLTSFLEISQER